jgi:hypothetical protein
MADGALWLWSEGREMMATSFGIMPTGRPSWPMIVATVVPAQMNAVI